MESFTCRWTFRISWNPFLGKVVCENEIKDKVRLMVEKLKIIGKGRGPNSFFLLLHVIIISYYSVQNDIIRLIYHIQHYTLFRQVTMWVQNEGPIC